MAAASVFSLVVEVKRDMMYIPKVPCKKFYAVFRLQSYLSFAIKHPSNMGDIANLLQHYTISLVIRQVIQVIFLETNIFALLQSYLSSAIVASF